MFTLSIIEHDLPLPPNLLSLPLTDAIRGELERLFLDKVILKLGLCVSVYDVLSIKGGIIYPGEGHSTYKVKFRLLMFRPFVGEVISGKIQESNTDGLRISLGFFSDIHIPPHLITQPSSFEAGDKAGNGIWSWKYGDDLLPLDLEDEVNFRVVSIKYPPIPVQQDDNAKPFAPMEIVGSMADDGLGCVSWWEP